MYRRHALSLLVGLLPAALLPLNACESETATPVAAKPTWQLPVTEYSGAFFSAWGTSSSDVWIVGAADHNTANSGPAVLHFDGSGWQKTVVDAPGIDFWWVSGLAGGDTWFAGTKGTIARWHRASSKIEVEKTPGTDHIFGLLPVSATDVWAVGGSLGCGAPNNKCGVVWHFDGTAWAKADVPANLLTGATQWFKAWKHNGILWIVGAEGKVLRYDGSTWTSPATPSDRTILTIHGNGALLAAVGGAGTGDILELGSDGAWQKVTPSAIFPMMNGVYVPKDGNAVAVGGGAAIARRTAGAWAQDKVARNALEDLGAYEDFHGVYVDPDGGVWAVGGQIISDPPVLGQVCYFGSKKVPKLK